MLLPCENDIIWTFRFTFLSMHKYVFGGPIKVVSDSLTFAERTTQSLPV